MGPYGWLLVVKLGSKVWNFGFDVYLAVQGRNGANQISPGFPYFEDNSSSKQLFSFVLQAGCGQFGPY